MTSKQKNTAKRHRKRQARLKRKMQEALLAIKSPKRK